MSTSESMNSSKEGASRILGNSDKPGGIRGDAPRAPQSVLKSWTDPSKEKQTLSRREALKALAAAVAIPHFAEQWETPVVEIGYLPALAQASPPVLGTGNLQATLTWNTGNPDASKCSNIEKGKEQGAVDIDLHVVEPDGTRVFWNNLKGSTAKLDIDNKNAFGPENIFVPADQSSEGIYQIQVVYYCGAAFPTIATIVVRVFADTAQEQVATFTRVLEQENSNIAIKVAEVTFPGGTIQEVTGSVPVPANLHSASKGK